MIFFSIALASVAFFALQQRFSSPLLFFFSFLAFQNLVWLLSVARARENAARLLTSFFVVQVGEKCLQVFEL
jgi:hypothetical protein